MTEWVFLTLKFLSVKKKNLLTGICEVFNKEENVSVLHQNEDERMNHDVQQGGEWIVQVEPVKHSAL